MDAKKVAALAKKKGHERTEDDWDSIYDAKTLTNARLIEDDPARLERARLWAAVLLQEEKNEAEAMGKVANA